MDLNVSYSFNLYYEVIHWLAGGVFLPRKQTQPPEFVECGLSSIAVEVCFAWFFTTSSLMH